MQSDACLWVGLCWAKELEDFEQRGRQLHRHRPPEVQFRLGSEDSQETSVCELFECFVLDESWCDSPHNHST